MFDVVERNAFVVLLHSNNSSIHILFYEPFSLENFSSLLTTQSKMLSMGIRMRNFIVDVNANVYSNWACSFVLFRLYRVYILSTLAIIHLWKWIGMRLDCTWNDKIRKMRGAKRMCHCHSWFIKFLIFFLSLIWMFSFVSGITSLHIAYTHFSICVLHLI